MDGAGYSTEQVLNMIDDLEKLRNIQTGLLEALLYIVDTSKDSSSVKIAQNAIDKTPKA